MPQPADKLLFTPGPLTTSATVKEAALRDLGSRDDEFIALIQDIRARLVSLAGVTSDRFTAVPMQGSGTFAVEAAIGTAVPSGGALLVAINGAYGRRMQTIAEVLGIATRVIECPENSALDPEVVAQTLEADASITHVAACHVETTSGVLNPIAELGEAVAAQGRTFIVDAMSSFGGIPLNVESTKIDFLISSANKCIQGIPGFGYVIARTDRLLDSKGNARSLSLDLVAQYEALEANGQFRFTPPTHALLAFGQALDELDAEGGVTARYERYRENHARLSEGMTRLGFECYLPESLQAPIITSFPYPADPSFDFTRFYHELSARGFAIYPGKVTGADCFRIGNIGHIGPEEIDALLRAVKAVLVEMGISMPARETQA